MTRGPLLAAIEVVALVVTVGVPGGRALADEGWGATFSPEQVGPYLSGHPAVVVTAAEGTGDPEAEAAAGAFVESLRRSGRARSVMTVPGGSVAPPPAPARAGSGRGGAAAGGESDGVIVRRLAALPVEVIAVVRSWPEEGGRAALVALYDPTGRLVVGMSGVRGRPIADRRGEDDYERRFVGWTVGYAYRQDAATGAWTVRRFWEAPYLGRGERPLVGEAFYRAVEQPALAGQEHVRFARRRALLGVGGATLGAGLLTTVLGALAGEIHPFCYEQDITGLCLDANRGGNGVVIGVGVAVGVAGLATLIAGAALRPDPVSDAARRRLTYEHNVRLRHELGLPPRPDPRSPDGDDRPPPETAALPPPPPAPPPLPSPTDNPLRPSL